MSLVNASTALCRDGGDSPLGNSTGVLLGVVFNKVIVKTVSVMRKVLKVLLLTLVMTFVTTNDLFAQVNYFKTTEFASKKKNSSGNWGSWSDWQPSDMLVKVDLDNDIVTIFSPTRQVYQITEHIKTYTDNSGGKQMEFAFIDQDGDRGHIRFRVETNNNNQIYIDFSNMSWCYNVKKI